MAQIADIRYVNPQLDRDKTNAKMADNILAMLLQNPPVAEKILTHYIETINK
jgi:hypothetical protein